MSKEIVYLEIENSIGTIYINRPEKRNALTYEMWEKISQLLDVCEENEDVKVIIFKSTTSTAFSAGADISEFQSVRSTKEGAEKYNQLTMIVEEKLVNCLKPSIAQIQGFCVGGGCEIAVACDFRFTDESGKFGITPSKLGLVYNTPGTKNLVDLVGPSNAKDILFTGRIIGAEEAMQIGLVNKIVAKDELELFVRNYVELIINNAQMSVRGSKKIIHEVLKGASEDSEEIAEYVLESFVSTDYKEGVNAFLEKRKPNFTFK